MSAIVAAIGRILLALLFFCSGVMKLMNSTPAEGMLGQAGLSPQLAIPVGVFEVIAALCLALGLMTRLTAFLLAGYVALTILFFHNALADPAQQVNALKNLAIMSGMLMVFAYGQMRWSYDHWRARDKLRDADIRLAHAEGRAEGATAAAAEHTTTVVRD